MNLKYDTAKIPEKNVFQVHGVRQKLKEDQEKSHCFGCGGQHLKIYCPLRDKKCFWCRKVGYRQTHCKTKRENLQKPPKVMLTKIKDRNETRNRKFINDELNNKSIRMQLNMGSDVSIKDEKTWKAIRKPYLDLTRKVARRVCGKKNLIILYRVRKIYSRISTAENSFRK